MQIKKLLFCGRRCIWIFVFLQIVNVLLIFHFHEFFSAYDETIFSQDKHVLQISENRSSHNIKEISILNVLSTVNNSNQLSKASRHRIVVVSEDRHLIAKEENKSSHNFVQTPFSVNTNFTVDHSNKLPKSSKDRKLVFLHIGKNGGTSFDKEVGSRIRKHGYMYIGYRHFDWSYMSTIPNADPLVLLRDPVSRSISHFWFAKTLSWTKGMAIRRQNISQFLNDYQSMLDVRDVWQDGQAAVSWLTGTHIASWAGVNKLQVEDRERQSLNVTTMCILAAKRLQETFWFGFIEDLQRSMEMLQWQLGFDKPIKLPHTNSNNHQKATDAEKSILASLMPQDLWLHRYSKTLFEARWVLFKTGVWKPPIIPDPPEISCLSTRFILDCRRGPLSPLFYNDSNMPSNHKHYINELDGIFDNPH